MGKGTSSRRVEVVSTETRLRTDANPRSAHASPAPPTQLDRLIHDRIRLALVSALAVTPTLSFTELKAATRATDGNLSVHARRLEEAGYIRCEKKFAGRTPRTDYRITTEGRRALERYLNHMDAIIKATRGRLSE